MPTVKEEIASLVADFESRLNAIVDRAKKEALSKVRQAMEEDEEPAAPRRRGPGRPPATPAVGGAPAKREGVPRKNPWANLTPEEHLARVNAIRKGKGLPPKNTP